MTRFSKDVYTGGYAETLLQAPNFFNLIFGSSLYGNGRLRAMVARYVDKADARRDRARIRKGPPADRCHHEPGYAACRDLGHGSDRRQWLPDALATFRDVLVASASIPLVFPPTLIDVEANGRRFQEMHVDGAIITPVFTLPEDYLLRNARAQVARGSRLDLYVLLNAKIGPNFKVVDNSVLTIASRTVLDFRAHGIPRHDIRHVSVRAPQSEWASTSATSTRTYPRPKSSGI